MPLYAGIDIGAQSVKGVLFDGEKMLESTVLVTETESDSAARQVFSELLNNRSLEPSDVERIYATGWGADEVTFAHGKSSEQVCAARGARFLFPGARTVLDMGAEGCRAMRLSAEGMLEEFSNNSKCASGTGSFIELGAVYLKVGIEDMGPLSLAAEGVADVSSTCAVFAESVIISHIHNGETIERIAAGIHQSAATRVSELLGRIGIEKDVVFVGGPALNMGLVGMLEKMNRVPMIIPENPRIIVALGAALQASLKKKDRRRRK
ncbi:MAG: acyl-CoA dehydratase activase [Desulfobacterales bacterium]